jgi:hypothetical protein
MEAVVTSEMGNFNHKYVESTSPKTVFVAVILASTIIIIISSTALAWPWPLQANVTSDLYPGHPPANFYNPVSLRLPLSHQFIVILVSHVLVDLQGLSTISF